MIENVISEIVSRCMSDIKKFGEIVAMDYVDLFPTSEQNRLVLNAEATKLGKTIEQNERGTTYRLHKPIKTALGRINLIKVRKFDKTRLQWLGAGDFVVNDFAAFKTKYANAENCRYVEAPTYKAIEIKSSSTLAYVMDIPTSVYYKGK